MASTKDMKAANETYGGFVSLIKWGSILAGLATMFVVFLIAS